MATKRRGRGRPPRDPAEARRAAFFALEVLALEVVLGPGRGNRTKAVRKVAVANGLPQETLRKTVQRYRPRAVAQAEQAEQATANERQRAADLREFIADCQRTREQHAALVARFNESTGQAELRRLEQSVADAMRPLVDAMRLPPELQQALQSLADSEKAWSDLASRITLFSVPDRPI
jgi:hypothetical protein